MSVVVKRVDETQFNTGSDNGDGGGLDTQTNQTKHNPIGILEASLRFP
jgi:hypothetical protein